jgi:hypothetical protein
MRVIIPTLVGLWHWPPLPRRPKKRWQRLADIGTVKASDAAPPQLAAPAHRRAPGTRQNCTRGHRARPGGRGFELLAERIRPNPQNAFVRTPQNAADLARDGRRDTKPVYGQWRMWFGLSSNARPRGSVGTRRPNRSTHSTQTRYRGGHQFPSSRSG